MTSLKLRLNVQVRMRDTFMKAGYSLMQRRELGNEKNLKEQMIHSVMPPKVADWLMDSKGKHHDDDDNGSGGGGDGLGKKLYSMLGI